MEQELFLNGYCRMIDASRMVAVLIEDGSLTEVDCCYGNCIYRESCPVGKRITAELSPAEARS